MSEGDYRRWRTKAHQNIKKWGMQDLEQLTLAMTEELGELSQSILEYQHEDGEYGRIQEELDDLSALMIQMQKLLNSGTEVKPCE